ncbi:MAG: ABC transporter ATP-binding protein [Candidatus Heimdallarchaeota archaeon]|nr:ABC transporter ATP-binding protein [Candidatus Heimdallarchaeota archaeon]
MSWLEDKKRTHSAKEIAKVIWPYVAKRKGFLIFVSMVSFFAAIIGLITPLLIREVINSAIPENNLELVWIIGASILGVALFGGLLQYVSRFYAAKYAQEVIYELRNDIYEILQRLSLEFYDEENTGQIMTRVTTDLNAIQSLVSFTLRLIMNSVIYFIGAYVAMLVMSWQLGLILVALFPGFIWLVYWFSTKVRPLFYLARRQFGDVTSILQENVTGAHVVRGFAQEENEINKFDDSNTIYRDLRIKTQVYRAIYFSVMTLLIGIGTSLVIMVGGTQIVNYQLELGDFVAFLSYLALLPGPTRQLTWLVGIFQRSLASGDRIIELISAKREVQEDSNAINPPKFKGDITYINIFFEYEKGRPILKDININIPQGQKVVILGGTGSGKSSFVNLLSRFYNPSEGSIMIDSQNITKYKLKEMRKQIGLVLQETYLFNATLKENIAFGKPEATDEEVINVSKIAKIHDFISGLPEGYETKVGDRGITLSGGQKQRISIARTLLTDPSILVFDDSTASVDAETEAQIQDALDILSTGRTTLIISQRISSVHYADRVLVFESGEIIQDGKHNDLIKAHGLYQEIYHTLERSFGEIDTNSQEEESTQGSDT